MKASKFKSILLAAFAAAGFAAGSAAAAPTADRLIGAYDFQNSGDPDFLAQIEGITGNDYDLDDLIRDNSPNATQDASGLWVLNDAPTGAGYFLLKFGTGGTKVNFNTYIFENKPDLAQLVFSNAQVKFLTGGDCSNGPNDNNCNIGRLSHWVYVAGNGNGTGTPGGGEVPEPASLALLGLGLAGMALRRRRARLLPA